MSVLAGPSIAIFAMACVPFAVVTRPVTACPTDTVAVCGVVAASSTPAYSLTGCAFGTGSADYNLVSGTFRVAAGRPAEDAVVVASDDYEIVGPGGSSPISGTASLTVHATIFRIAFLDAVIECPTGRDSIRVSFSSTTGLVVPISASVGTPFPVTIRMHGHTSPSTREDYYATGSGDLTFSLPSGYSIASCQGFGSPPTPAAHTPWGRLRRLYR
jgi:hypothetical protein